MTAKARPRQTAVCGPDRLSTAGIPLRRAASRRWAGRFRGGNVGIETSLFALLGLLIAFSISGGESRLDARRRLIVEEANAIDTAYLRLNLMPAATQAGLRQQFRDYVDARIGYYDHSAT